MQIKKVNINLTETDIATMLENVCKTTQSVEKSNDIANLFTEVLLKSTEASSLFVQIMLGNGLPEALRKGDVIRCKWDRLKIGIQDAPQVYQKLQKNNLLNEDEEVTCKVKIFRGYTEYFPYVVSFKYGTDLYVDSSIGFEDVLS